MVCPDLTPSIPHPETPHDPTSADPGPRFRPAAGLLRHPARGPFRSGGFLCPGPLRPDRHAHAAEQRRAGDQIRGPRPDAHAHLRPAGAALRAGGLRVQEAGGEVAVAEPNREVFRTPQAGARASINLWGDASINLWGDASINLWGDASINLWGDGGYTVLPENTAPWRQMRLDAAQQASTALGQGVTVAVIDTGVDVAHPAFAGTLTPPATWYDFVDDDATPQDSGTLGTGVVGHGSEVAGLALQVAPRARIMPLRVLNEAGTGDVADVASAIVWAVDHGANVINLSLGASGAVEAVTQAIAYANAQGVAVVASAGNNGQAGLDHPAAEFGANDALNVSVGSVGAGDLKSSFSQYASSLTLLAPGEALTGPAPGGMKAAWSGTSMSTAVASGALALGLGERAGAAGAVTNLKASAVNVDALGGNAAYAGQLGQGRLDLGAFVQRQKTP